MKGSLLSSDDFLSLLNTDTYEEFFQVLNTTSYAKFLADKDVRETSIPVLTNIIYSSLFIDYEKTIRAIGGKTQKIFILLYQKYESTNLKTILRGICGKIASEKVSSLLLPTKHYTLFSKEQLFECQEVQEVVQLMQGTFFQYPLNQALHRFEKEKEFFPLEMALDLHYYRTLWDEVMKLPGEETRIVQKLIGMSIDILNVSWIIRFKEQYRFAPEEILNYIIEHGYAFKLSERRKLAETRTPGEILAYLETTQYGEALSGDTQLSTLHIVLTRYLATQLRKYFLGDPFQIGVILGYLLLKEFEVSDLITIAEAKMYGLSLEQSQDYVINV